MCESTASPAEAASSAPVAATGPAVDPIRLEPVDEISVTTLVDNVYDALLAGGGDDDDDDDDRTVRAPFAAGTAVAPQFESGRTPSGCWPNTG